MIFKDKPNQKNYFLKNHFMIKFTQIEIIINLGKKFVFV